MQLEGTGEEGEVLKVYRQDMRGMLVGGIKVLSKEEIQSLMTKELDEHQKEIQEALDQDITADQIEQAQDEPGEMPSNDAGGNTPGGSGDSGNVGMYAGVAVCVLAVVAALVWYFKCRSVPNPIHDLYMLQLISFLFVSNSVHLILENKYLSLDQLLISFCLHVDTTHNF